MTGWSDGEERRLEKAEDGDGSGKGQEKDRKEYSVLVSRRRRRMGRRTEEVKQSMRKHWGRARGNEGWKP
jgi:hypothetical protein